MTGTAGLILCLASSISGKEQIPDRVVIPLESITATKSVPWVEEISTTQKVTSNAVPFNTKGRIAIMTSAAGLT